MFDEEDVTKATKLLQSIKSGASDMDSHIQNILNDAQNGSLNTSKGLSFLEMKYQMLLSYLINLTYVMLQKVRGKSIQDDPAVYRLTEIRTVLEKIRPIDQKLKYQIDKLVKTAAVGTAGGSDPLRFRANPENLVSKDEEESGSESESDKEESKPKVYVPPKVAAMHYDGDLTVEERKQKRLDRAKKRAMSSSVVQELQAQYGDAPEEIRDTRDQYKSWEAKRAKEITDHEEQYFTRVSLSKREKNAMKQRRRRSEIDTLTTFGDFSGLIGDDELPEEDGPSRKKRRLSGKGKKGKKGFKKKRRTF